MLVILTYFDETQGSPHPDTYEVVETHIDAGEVESKRTIRLTARRLQRNSDSKTIPPEVVFARRYRIDSDNVEGLTELKKWCEDNGGEITIPPEAGINHFPDELSPRELSDLIKQGYELYIEPGITPTK